MLYWASVPQSAGWGAATAGPALRSGACTMRRVLTSLLAGVLLWGLAVPAGASEGGTDPGGAGDALTSPAHDSPASAPFAAAEAQSTSIDCAPWNAVDSDIVLDADVPCMISVVAEDVTVDLAGHSAGFILALADRVTIRNGTIAGALLMGSADALLDNVEVRDSSGHFAVEAGLRTVVRNSRFVGNTVGLSFYFADGGTVVGSTFTDNALGLVIGKHDDVTVRASRFERNEIGLQIWDEDLVGASSNVVEGNRFTDNTVGAQLLAASAAVGNRFAGNHFRRNQAAGLFVLTGCLQAFGATGCAGDGTEIAGNLLQHNGSAPVEHRWFDEDEEVVRSVLLDDGLHADGLPRALPGVRLSANLAVRNADLGIEAPGVTDGGGNLGQANGDPEQCVGVSCGPGVRGAGRRP